MQSTNLYVYAVNNPILFMDPSGFKTVAFYYNNPGSGFEDQVKKSAYFNYNNDDVEIISVISSQDFIDAWNSLDDSDLDDVYLYLHGGEGKLYFKGETMNMTGNKSLASLTNKNAEGKVYLFSCHGGAGKEVDNVAWRFSELTGATVSATESSVSYSEIFGKYYARVSAEDFWNPFDNFWSDYYYEKEYILWGDIVAKKSTRCSKWTD